MYKFMDTFRDSLQSMALGLLSMALMAAGLAYRLGNLTPAANQAEADFVRPLASADLSINWLLEQSLYLPYKIAAVGLDQFGWLNLTSLRGLSLAFGIAGAVGFFLIVRTWYTKRVAVMATFLLVTANWFLHTARLGLPSSMYLLLPLLIYLFMKLDEGTQRLSVVVLAMLTGVGLLYTPATVWLFAVILIWQRRRVSGYIQEIPTAAVLAIGLGGLILLIPLLVALVITDGLWLEWLGVPDNVDWRQVGNTLIRLPWAIAVRQTADFNYRLGHLPWLDVAASALALLGIYRHTIARRLDRVGLIIGGLIFGALVYSLFGPAYSGVLVIFVYLLVAGGLALLLQQWFTVFPRNPLARGIGLGLVTIMVALIGFYQLKRYYVAWPQAPETKQLYGQPLPLDQQ